MIVDRNTPASQPPGDHGTLRRWLDGCTCEDCTATRDRVRDAAHRNKEPDGRLAVDLWLVGAEHGTARGYSSYGCGCRPCRAAYSRLRTAQAAAATRAG